MAQSRLAAVFVTILLALSGLGNLALASEETPQTRPNIVVILADDLGYADVGFQGARDFDTPNIDRLAAEGMTFSQAYVSHPYCSPSRAGLLTGRYQAHFGHEYNPPDLADDQGGLVTGTDLNEVFLSQAMKDAGYATVAIGKWHLGSSSRFLPHNRGFDEFYGFGGGGRSYWPDSGVSLGKRMRSGDDIVAEETLSYMTDELTDYAIDYVRRSGQQPFFMYLAYNAPHAPDHATAEDLAATEHIMYGQRSVYAAMVYGMDRNIGRLIAELEKQGLRNNTLIVFLSDNGGRNSVADNSPLRGHKGLLYEGGLRTPFIVSMPGRIEAGRVSDAPVIALDIFPTALEAAGASVPANVDGRSLWPLLFGASDAPLHEALFWRVIDGQGYAVRDGEWKLVKPAATDQLRLYNLALDPQETQDVAARYADRVAALQAKWDRWNEAGIATAWSDAHGPNVAKEYCDWRDKRAAALPPAARSGARCPQEMIEQTLGTTKNSGDEKAGG